MLKITLLRTQQSDTYGTLNRSVLFWYTISPRITDSAGNTIVPMPSSVLQSGSDAARYVTAQADVTALDSGDAAFEIVAHQQTLGETDTQFKNRMLAEHTARQTGWIAAKRAEYALAGFASN